MNHNTWGKEFFRNKPSPRSGATTRVQNPFIRPAFHQLHARRERSTFLSPFFFRIYLFEPLPAPLQSPRTTASLVRIKSFLPSSPPSPSTRFITDVYTHKRTREEIDVKDKEGGSAQGQGVKGEVSYVSRMRAHDSCFHEWKVLLVFWRSGSMVHRKRLVTPCFRLRARYYL